MERSLIELIDRVLAGSGSTQDLDAFTTRMSLDREFAKDVARHAMLLSNLRVGRLGLASADAARPATGTNDPEPEVAVYPRIANSRGVERAAATRSAFIIGIAAVILIMGAAIAIYVFAANPQSSPPHPSSGPIATLIGSTGTTLVNDAIVYSGSDLAAGEYAIEGGNAEFLLTSRVTVDLRGRTRLEMQSPMRASLSAGTARFQVPEGAEGFTVSLPGGARVVDLGTAFTVSIDAAGETQVYLLEGIVELHTTDGSVQLLRGRDAWRVDANGRRIATIDPAEAPEIVAFDSAWVDADGADYAAAVLADDPAVYWRFDRALEGHTLDQSGDRRHLSIEGDATLAPGHLGRALRMQRNGWAECPKVVDLMVTDAYTVECWVRADEAHNGAVLSLGHAVLIEFLPAGDRDQPMSSIRYLHRPLGHQFTGGNEIYHPYQPGRWYHLAAVKTSDAMILYVDGERVAAADNTESLDTAAPAFALGRLSMPQGSVSQRRPLQGAIDELAIYRRALSPEQVRDHFQAALPKRETGN